MGDTHLYLAKVRSHIFETLLQHADGNGKARLIYNPSDHFLAHVVLDTRAVQGTVPVGIPGTVAK